MHRTTSVSWQEPKARFTAEFEALVIDWLQDPSILAEARMTGLSWNAIDGVMQRPSSGAIYLHLEGLDLYPYGVSLRSP